MTTFRIKQSIVLDSIPFEILTYIFSSFLKLIQKCDSNDKNVQWQIRNLFMAVMALYKLKFNLYLFTLVRHIF